ncbi:MAG: tRNA (guanosine(37)-N1)-methyltransferase TrmD [Myxococcota bacterium]
MHIDFLSVLPEIFEPVMRLGVVGRAATEGRFTWRAINIRSFSTGRHRMTDEAPFGGGAGMVMKPEPLVSAIRWASAHGPDVPAPPWDAVDTPAPSTREVREGRRVVLMDAAGPPFTQETARRYAALEHLVLVCGRYEGVDERVRAHVDELLSIGDYVLTGGELAALVVTDASVRLLPGVLGNVASTLEESHSGGLLEYPQYTRPRDFEGALVPELLLSGDHAKIGRWRRQQALVRTRALRPDVFSRLTLTEEDQRLLDEADGKPPPPRRKRSRRKAS